MPTEYAITRCRWREPPATTPDLGLYSCGVLFCGAAAEYATPLSPRSRVVASEPCMGNALDTASNYAPTTTSIAPMFKARTKRKTKLSRFLVVIALRPLHGTLHHRNRALRAGTLAHTPKWPPFPGPLYHPSLSEKCRHHRYYQEK